MFLYQAFVGRGTPVAFDFVRFVNNIESSFHQGGAHDLREYISRHIAADRWIIASDYNTCSRSAKFDVYSFACYPVESGIETLRDGLQYLFPRDFKDTGAINREQKRFFNSDVCFCFVFLVDRSSKFLRSGDVKHDLREVRRYLDELIERISNNGTHQSIIDNVKILRNEASKGSFSLYLFERILLLSMFNAFVAWKITANTKVSLFSWFPDQDNMTTYAGNVFNILSMLNYNFLWQLSYSRDTMPQIRFADHRLKNKSLNDMIDDLIRVPDFLSAVLSRWDLEKRKIINPGGAKRETMIRYVRIVRHWQAENSRLWLANTRLEEGDLRTGRIITATSLKKLDRLTKRLGLQAPGLA